MKKFTPIAALAVLAIMFTSCKKDYSCTCITTEPGTIAKTNKITIENQKQKDAESACTAKSKKETIGTVQIEVSCSLD